MAKFFLRKRGTDRVFIRTAILSQRDDMIPISEPDAIALMEQHSVSQREAAEKRRNQDVRDEPPKVESENVVKKQAAPASSGPEFESMDEDALRKYADEHKIFVHHASKKAKIIETITTAMKESGAPITSSGGVDVTPPPAADDAAPQS
jgi:hypothetical protein